jgi:hypothetical protein
LKGSALYERAAARRRLLARARRCASREAQGGVPYAGAGGDDWPRARGGREGGAAGAQGARFPCRPQLEGKGGGGPPEHQGRRPSEAPPEAAPGVGTVCESGRALICT